VADDEAFLSRWSRRKLAARTQPREEEALPPARADQAPPAETAEPREMTPDGSGAAGAPAEPAPLPPVESLTPESDFSPFMSREVDSATRNKALKALFADPHFNTMDMLDVYVDDYSKPDPIPESWLSQLEQLSHLGDRAARDRAEEEERRRALASGEAPPEGHAGARPPPAGEPQSPPAAEANGPDPAATRPLDPVGQSDAGNPPFSVGESGT
jgi:hypothetical protein